MASVIRKLLATESAWNPKVMAGRIATRVLPEKAIHNLKKHYYAYLLTHMPKDWVERDAQVLHQFVSPHDNVVDIGANLGVFSRYLAALVGNEGQVYAFEPIPQTFEFLAHNVKKLRLTQVKPLPFALSDSCRSDTMVIPTYRWGSECWYDACIKTADTKAGLRELRIESRTLDSFNLPRISFIKCDTNGHELATLKGAWETIRRDHPVMLIEVNPDPDDVSTTAYETFSLLVSEGYTAHVLRDGQMLSRQPGERSQNYFFLPNRSSQSSPLPTTML